MGNQQSENDDDYLFNETLIHELSQILIVHGDAFLEEQKRLDLSPYTLSIITEIIQRPDLRYFNGIDAPPSGQRNRRVHLQSGIDIINSRQVAWDAEEIKAIIEKLPQLKVYNSGEQTIQGFVDIGSFTGLRCLHLEGIPIHLVQHLQTIRPLLQELVARRCLENCKSLLELCGGDQAFPAMWSHLTFLDISYNNISMVDESMKFLSTLRILDLSHNSISQCDNLSLLPQLERLNLTQNQLTNVPNLGPIAANMRCLIISRNFIMSLDGLNLWHRLEELDLRENCVENVSEMCQLTLLRSLIQLRFEENPVCYVRDYRNTILSYIAHTVPSSFCLDGQPLSRKENRLLHRATVGIPAQANSYQYQPTILDEEDDFTMDDVTVDSLQPDTTDAEMDSVAAPADLSTTAISVLADDENSDAEASRLNASVDSDTYRKTIEKLIETHGSNYLAYMNRTSRETMPADELNEPPAEEVDADVAVQNGSIPEARKDSSVYSPEFCSPTSLSQSQSQGSTASTVQSLGDEITAGVDTPPVVSQSAAVEVEMTSDSDNRAVEWHTDTSSLNNLSMSVPIASVSTLRQLNSSSSLSSGSSSAKLRRKHALRQSSRKSNSSAMLTMINSKVYDALDVKTGDRLLLELDCSRGQLRAKDINAQVVAAHDLDDLAAVRSDMEDILVLEFTVDGGLVSAEFRIPARDQLVQLLKKLQVAVPKFQCMKCSRHFAKAACTKTVVYVDEEPQTVDECPFCNGTLLEQYVDSSSSVESTPMGSPLLQARTPSGALVKFTIGSTTSENSISDELDSSVALDLQTLRWSEKLYRNADSDISTNDCTQMTGNLRIIFGDKLEEDDEEPKLVLRACVLLAQENNERLEYMLLLGSNKKWLWFQHLAMLSSFNEISKKLKQRGEIAWCNLQSVSVGPDGQWLLVQEKKSSQCHLLATQDRYKTMSLMSQLSALLIDNEIDSVEFESEEKQQDRLTSLVVWAEKQAKMREPYEFPDVEEEVDTDARFWLCGTKCHHQSFSTVNAVAPGPEQWVGLLLSNNRLYLLKVHLLMARKRQNTQRVFSFVNWARISDLEGFVERRDWSFLRLPFAQESVKSRGAQLQSSWELMLSGASQLLCIHQTLDTAWRSIMCVPLALNEKKN